MNSDGQQIAVLCPEGEDAGQFEAAVRHAEGVPVVIRPEGLPASAGGLLVAGEGHFGAGSEDLPVALSEAIERDLPVLGIGWGMQAINVAFGGMLPVAIDDHRGSEGGPVKHSVFMSPGGKVSYTIGGSGWVSVNGCHSHGIRDAQRAEGLLASAYAEDRVIEAIELPGRHWVIGVQWQAHRIDEQPKGFDNLLLALVERAIEG
ncbi:MAG: gamma-glutamyl-gamma-aminobutyrate hydrolase family protein [Dehalococcoidia bacterium]